MTCLYVVIAESLRVVFQVIHHLSSDVRQVGLHVVGVVAGRLSLQDVPILQENQVVAKCLPLSIKICTHACHTATHRFALYEVIGEEGSMYVGRLNQTYCDGLVFLSHRDGCQAHECDSDEYCLFHSCKGRHSI